MPQRGLSLDLRISRFLPKSAKSARIENKNPEDASAHRGALASLQDEEQVVPHEQCLAPVLHSEGVHRQYDGK